MAVTEEQVRTLMMSALRETLQKLEARPDITGSTAIDEACVFTNEGAATDLTTDKMVYFIAAVAVSEDVVQIARIVRLLKQG